MGSANKKSGHDHILM